MPANNWLTVCALIMGVNIISGTIKANSTSQQTGEYTSDLEAEISGNTVSVLLNHRYMLDGLAHVTTPQTKMQIVNAESPCLFTAAKSDGFRYIVMPIRQ
jgi:DNA polymerase III sliding clamp (beta) subunit (PCNA family)